MNSDFIPVVIVTGASGGVGEAVACWLAGKRASIVLVARTGASLGPVAKKVEEIGGSPLVAPMDVSNPESCKAVVNKTVRRFGRIDGLVNNAATVQPLARTGDADPDAWAYNINVNLLGPFFMARFALEEIRRSHGRIVNVSSGAANIAIAAAGAYCAAKAALNQFTKVLAGEEPEVTCVAVRPGVVDTRMQEDLRRDGLAVMPGHQHAYYRQLKSDGKLEHPAIPGRSIAWLALHAPKNFSGRFLDYDDPMIMNPAVSVFGGDIRIASPANSDAGPGRNPALS